MRRRATVLLLMSPILLVLVGVSAGAAVRVVATTTLIGDVVERIGGDMIDLTILFEPDTDPHLFEPTPHDLVDLQQADVVFLNGAGLEAGLTAILQTVESAVSLSDALARPSSVDGDHDHGELDPHVWFDPSNVMQWAERIAETLARLDPAHASEFEERAAQYGEELAELDRWIEARVAGLSATERVLVTDHGVLAYFAERYGFTLVGSVFPGLSTAAEPSARELADLETRIRDLGVSAIFVSTTVDPRLAEQVGRDTGVSIVHLYTGSLSGPDGPAPTYLDLMRVDVDRIVEALSGNEGA